VTYLAEDWRLRDTAYQSHWHHYAAVRWPVQRGLHRESFYDAKDLGFRLKPGAAAVDRGVALPNVTDGFAGRAPDLGAIELGQAAPHCGPRR